MCTNLGSRHFGNTRQEAFKCCGPFQYLLCTCDHVEQFVASFTHQIQSKYYVKNRSVSIEGIALDNFSSNKQPV